MRRKGTCVSFTEYTTHDEAHKFSQSSWLLEAHKKDLQRNVCTIHHLRVDELCAASYPKVLSVAITTRHKTQLPNYEFRCIDALGKCQSHITKPIRCRLLLNSGSTVVVTTMRCGFENSPGPCDVDLSLFYPKCGVSYTRYGDISTNLYKLPFWTYGQTDRQTEGPRRTNNLP